MASISYSDFGKDSSGNYYNYSQLSSDSSQFDADLLTKGFPTSGFKVLTSSKTPNGIVCTLIVAIAVMTSIVVD